MRDDFCAFILTHGRPDRVHTYKTLMKSGYTGKIYIVIDDEDETADEYRKRFGDKVLQFSKSEIEKQIDTGDNFQDRRTILHARNACFDLAKKVGCRFFIELDDDYPKFHIRFNSKGLPSSCLIKSTFNDVILAMLEFYESIPVLSLAMSQGGDFIGGGQPEKRVLKRKAMNSFICSIDRPFKFRSTFNEDVATYTTLSRQGLLFFTVMQVNLTQQQTQSNDGGITELYKRFGTYVKSFSTVMHCPSSVKVGIMGDPRSPHYRIHHKINWNVTAPKILREEWKK